MDALERAKRLMVQKEGWRNKANDEGDMDIYAEYSEREDLCRSDAIAYAAIAQAEQLKRIADATERRNELLHEFNQANTQSAVAHTEAMNTGIKKILGAFYGPDDSN